MLTQPRALKSLRLDANGNNVVRWQGQNGRSYDTFEEAAATFSGFVPLPQGYVPAPSPPPPEKPKVSRDAALAYALFNHCSERTAREHLRRVRGPAIYGGIPAYERLGKVIRMLSDTLPADAAWALEGHYLHAGLSIVVSVPLSEYDIFLNEELDDVRENLSQLNVCSIEVLTDAEAAYVHVDWIGKNGKRVNL